MGSWIPKLHSLRVSHTKSAIVELLVLSLVPVQLGLSHMDIENMNIELALKINIISSCGKSNEINFCDTPYFWEKIQLKI